MMTIEEVKNISFRRSGKSGYNAEDVDEFIDNVLATLKQYESEKSDIMKKIEILAKKIEKYRADEDIIKNALIKSERIAEISRAEAKEEADKILDSAKQEADNILKEAVNSAVEKKKELVTLKKVNADFRAKLLDMYKNQITLISELPNEVPAEPQTAQTEKSAVETEPDAAASNINASHVQSVTENAGSETEEIKRVPLTVSAEQAVSGENTNRAHTAGSGSSDAHTNESDLALEEVISPVKDKKRRRFSVLKFGDNYDIDDE